jgi:hypothetical protein
MRSALFGLAGLVLVNTPVFATQTPTSVGKFDPALVAPYADSFVTMIRGVPQGWHRYSLEQVSDGLRFRDDFALGTILQRSLIVSLTPELGVKSVRATGHELGQDVAVHLDYYGRRARGWAIVRGDSQPHRVAIDTALPEHAFDGQALMALLPLLDWHVGATYSLTMFDTDEANITTQLLHITDLETITVPAGTFAAFRADLSTTQSPVRLWYTTTRPHRLLKIGGPTDTFVTMLVGRASQ